MKADTMTKKSPIRNVRTRLADITNSLPQLKAPAILKEAPSDVSKYIDQLVKEKMALVKSLQEKNKIIELTGIEIQKLRTCLEKMQLQNQSLAQSNSHMLAELNTGKQRLKVLQHELACKEAILKSKDLEIKKLVERLYSSVSQTKEQKKVNTHANELKEIDKEGTKVVDSEPGHDENIKPCKTNKRGRPSRTRSLGSGSQVVSQLHAEKEAVGSKRHRVRIQSASAKITRQEQSENLFEIDDDAKFRDLKPSNASFTKKQVIEGGYGSKSHDEESQRISTGRPTRRSVVKIQSYKEIPINVKMRRPE